MQQMNAAMIDVAELCLKQGAFQLAGVSFSIPKGQYAILMGKTGAGKTTLLEAIAGLRTIVSGRILLAGRDVTDRPPAERGVGYVPQDAALFRTMTVRENLAFALTVRGQATAAIQQRVAELADWLQIGHLLQRRPLGLSGGETQRVALGRALASHPPVLLMDEPLASLDEETRARLMPLLKDLPQRSGATVLHVTHGSREAELLGDIVLQLTDGRVEAVGRQR